MLEYMIVTEQRPYELEKVVTLFIKEGWQPQGGVLAVQRFVNVEGSSLAEAGLLWAQAMVRTRGED